MNTKPENTLPGRFNNPQQISETPDIETCYVQNISVTFEYPIYFTRRLFSDRKNLTLRTAATRREPDRCHRVVVLVDNNVAQAHPSLLADLQAYISYHSDVFQLAAPTCLLQGGETIKDDHAAVFELQAWFHSLHLDRQSCVVAIGGGAVLDMVGFAAAICHRGLRMIRIPTTVLAQNGSGVGVKTAINAFGNKNFLGTFTPPFAVINDFDFLDTLSRRDRISGIAEAVKVALIRDRSFFDWLGSAADKLVKFEPEATQWMIQRCAQLHLQHIASAGDPFEFGNARPLDFGHWAAHKLENMTSYALRHGEAVAIGIALDTCYSAKVGMLKASLLDKVCSLLEQLGLRLWHDALNWRDDRGQRRVLQGLAEFREQLGGDLTITLLSELGQGREVHEIDAQLVDSAIEWLAIRNA